MFVWAGKALQVEIINGNLIGCFIIGQIMCCRRGKKKDLIITFSSECTDDRFSVVDLCCGKMNSV